jgi:DNA-binding SARP family transcriptional activator
LNVTIRLLGSPEIRRDGTRVEVDTRKAIALLAYLVISGPAVTRDHAAALLWPDHDHSRARAALRRTLSTLRGAIGCEHLETTRQRIELVLTGLDIDVLRFENLAPAADPASLREAWKLYRGDLLFGFGLRDSANFDDWQRRETERLRTTAGDVLDRLALMSEQRGDLAEAVQYTEARLSLDPLSEPAHRRLMELEARRGERGAAVARYRTLVRTLSEELGVEPLDETTALYEAIRRGEAPRQPEPAAPGATDSPLPFCGRDSELSAILAAIPRVRRHGHLVVIAGDAGMGTTRLAHEAADRLGATGAVVASARCHAHESELGYASIVSLIRSLLDGRTASELDLAPTSAAQVAGLVPELAEAEIPPAGVFRLYEALTEVVLALTDGPGPPILILDDVHRIDAAGRSYLTFLVNRVDTIPIVIVATVHPDEADPSDSLLSLARDLQGRGRATLVDIGTLAEDDTAALAATAGCHDATELQRTTGGVPLFIAEYLRSDCEGALQAGAVPESLGRIVTNRLARLKPATSQIFAAVALLAEPTDIELIRRVAGRSIDEVAEAIDNLVGAGLLIGDGQGRYSTANTLTAQVAYEQIGPERRRLLHHRAAVALGESSGHKASAAHHYQRSGDREAAARAFVAAGDDARRVFANDAAKSCYRAALDLGHSETDRLRESIADLATAEGTYAEARHHYELVAATSTGTDLARIEEKLGLLHLRLGNPEIAVSHFRSALAEAGDDATTSARLLANTAAGHAAAGDLAEASTVIEEARIAAEQVQSGSVLAAVENVRGSIARQSGDEAGAREAFERSLHLAEVHDDVASRIAAANNLALALSRDGRRDRARELLESALALAMRTGEEHRAAALHSNLADILQQDGETADAADHIRRMAGLMAEISAQFDDPIPEIWMQTAW